jgi:hypothetical protein
MDCFVTICTHFKSLLCHFDNDILCKLSNRASGMTACEQIDDAGDAY